MVETEIPQMKMLHGVCHFTCWISDTHSEHVTFIASSRQQCLRERVSTLRSHAHGLLFLSRLRAIRKEIDGTIYL
jgi:hypothetical protein